MIFRDATRDAQHAEIEKLHVHVFCLLAQGLTLKPPGSHRSEQQGSPDGVIPLLSPDLSGPLAHWYGPGSSPASLQGSGTPGHGHASAQAAPGGGHGQGSGQAAGLGNAASMHSDPPVDVILVSEPPASLMCDSRSRDHAPRECEGAR